MNESSITIRWDKNPDGSTDISVSGDIDGQTHFREAFLSLDSLPPLHDITERETSGESAGKSATIALLTQLIAIIRKSDKISGAVISEHGWKGGMAMNVFDDIAAKIIGYENLEHHSFESLEECCSYFLWLATPLFVVDNDLC